MAVEVYHLHRVPTSIVIEIPGDQYPLGKG